jgi:hypothetical protein
MLNNMLRKKSYFIKLKDQENMYLHFIGQTSSGGNIYEVREGIIGAAMWKKRSAKLFIKLHLISNAFLIDAETEISKNK